MKVGITFTIPIEIAKLLEREPNASHIVTELLLDYYEKHNDNFEEKIKELKQKHKEIVKNMKELKKKMQIKKKIEYVVSQEDTKEARFNKTNWGKR